MKKRLFLLATMWIGLVISVFAAEKNPSAAYIQRTMKSLEESTAENPAHVRVLFYGQSIVAQAWTKTVQEKLQEKYPTAKFTFVNKAIGGYTAPSLLRTAEEDLYPWYPDLLFFHVYGDLDKYEQIVKTVRERTTAEIVLWTSHLSANQNAKEMSEKRDERSLRILEIAKKYHCMVIDLNQKWYRMLLENDWPSQQLLQDGIHLKPEGCERYAAFIFEELVRIPGASGEEASSGKITMIPADGSQTLTFTGNRVCAVSNGQGNANATATFLLDGQPLETHKSLWTHTRPSNGPRWMPAINTVGWNVPLVEEEWTLVALPDSAKDGSKIHYQVTGSVTGPDGEGWSDQDFTSKSGRVVILANDYATWQYKLFKAELPENYQVTWKSVPLFAKPYRPAPAGERVLLLEHCENGPHTLTILPQGGDLGIKAFEVNAPSKAEY